MKDPEAREEPSSGAKIGLPGFKVRKIEEEVYEVFIGPQHPGSGHMRLITRIDGDVIVDIDPDIGYVHRTMEKLAEGREYIKNIPLFERMAIHDACNVTVPYVRAVEKLLGVDPPPRAKYLRSLLCEINRIAAHLYGFGIMGIFIGHSTMYMWSFGDREVFIDLAERLTGARQTHSYPVFGGVKRDMPQGFPEMARKAVRYMRKRLPEYEKIFFENPVVRDRLEGVGVIPRQVAAELGLVGPTARGSSIKYDARLAEGYDAYPELDFEIPVYTEGDSLARTYVKIEEIKQSLNIIEQCVSWLETREREAPMHPKFWEKSPPLWKKVYQETGRIKLLPIFASLKVPPGRAVARGETARGEIIYYVESDGSTKPYRVRIVSPSFRNLPVFKYIVPGHRVMDLPAIYGSIDYFPPEADR
ncbi:MAG: NADH-quinone oxidoreductase subunit D [Desulfurococcales archaeon]|nr:NADH-quinone oxidoreductase subunit D [Desulfurococcales archaeon]